MNGKIIKVAKEFTEEMGYLAGAAGEGESVMMEGEGRGRERCGCEDEYRGG